jgi:ribosomal protein L7/L12
MGEYALTVEDLIALLQRKISAGTIQSTDRLVWDHTEWGFVDICGIVVPNSENDSGLAHTVSFRPMKHIPVEKAEYYFNISVDSVESVRNDQKILAIKAFRFIDAVRGGTMGLAEAKNAVESIRPDHPFIFERILPHQIKACGDQLRVDGVGFHIEKCGISGENKSCWPFENDTDENEDTPF